MGLKPPCLRDCGFESHLAYQFTGGSVREKCDHCGDTCESYYFGFYDSDHRDQEKKFCSLTCSIEWIKTKMLR